MTDFAAYKGAVQAGAIAPDGKHVATVAGAVLHLWDASGKRVSYAKGHERRIHTVVFSASVLLPAPPSACLSTRRLCFARTPGPRAPINHLDVPRSLSDSAKRGVA